MPPVSGLTTAKAISGRVVSSPEALPERPRLSVISGRRGPTPVMMIRRQKATRMMLSIIVRPGEETVLVSAFVMIPHFLLIFIAVVLPVDLIDKAAQQDDGPDEMQPEHQNNKRGQ